MSEQENGVLKWLVSTVLALCGCGSSEAVQKGSLAEPTIVEEISIIGFDPDGEPVIKKWSDGTIWIQFEAMPPFYAEGKGIDAEFEHFDAKLQRALGVPVSWEDREVFIVKKPTEDTVKKAKQWLESYRTQSQ